MSKDYYKILGVDKKASKDEIKKAFYKLAHQHHPDKNGGNDTKFKEVNEAYQTLSDDKKRAQYDQFGTTGASGFGSGSGGNPFGGGFEGFDFSNFGFGGQGGNVHFDFGGDMGDIFGDMFGFGGGNKRSRQKVGEDLQILIQISFSESFTGVTKKVNFTRPAKCGTCSGLGHKKDSKKHDCKKCSGTGRVTATKKSIFGSFQQTSACAECEGDGKIYDEKCTECKAAGVKMQKEEINIPIPEGVEDGEQLLMRGYGESIKGGENGDLYIVVRVESNKNYVRKNLNLYTKVDVTLTDIILGNKLKIKDVLNNDLEIQIPQNQNPKESILLKGKGFKRSGRAGDIYVELNLQIPKHLSKKAKELLEELKKEGI